MSEKPPEYGNGKPTEQATPLTEAELAEVDRILRVFTGSPDPLERGYAAKMARLLGEVRRLEATTPDGELFQRLYASEIEFHFTAIYDGGFDWGVGNGAEGSARTAGEALKAMGEAAAAAAPGSAFAQWWRTR